jgi:hypothetical protein
MEVLRSKSVVALLVCIVAFSAMAKKKPTVSRLSLQPLSALKSLTGNNGYLLIDLNVNGIAPSIEFFKIKGEKSHYLEKGHRPIKLIGPRRIDLKGIKQGLYGLELPEGLYQITTINAPFYDLPFQKSTDNQRDWRFSIEAGKFNYVGHLFIDKERRAKYVTIRLFNRIATDFNKLSEALNLLTVDFPLASGVGVRDDFYQELSGRGKISEVVNNIELTKQAAENTHDAKDK